MYIAITYCVFFTILSLTKIPHLLIILILAYLSNLSGCLTNYTVSSAPIFFNGSKVTAKYWNYINFLVSVINLSIWGVIGVLWWKILNLW